VPGTSSLTFSFCLSSTAGGSSGTVGFTNTVFEEEGTSEEEAIPKTSLVIQVLLDGQHTSQLLISDSL
jgi:hypothetical protein